MLHWKRPYRDWRTFLFYPAIVVLLTGGIVGALAHGPPGHYVWLTPLAIGLLTLLFWRLAREGIYVSAEGVRIQSLVRSRVLRWEEIHRVDDELKDPSQRAIGFRTTSHEVVRSPVQQMGGVVLDQYAPMLPERTYTRLVKRLRELHRSAAKSSGTADR